MSRPNPSGVGQYTQELLRALFEIDNVNEYILFSSGKTIPPLPNLSTEALAKVEGGLGGVASHNFFHIPIPNKLLNLRSLLLKHPPINWRVPSPIDLIFLPNLNITVLPTDIPTVLTIHDLSWKLYPEFYSKKMLLWHKAVQPEKLIAQSSRIICPSTSTAEDLERCFGTDRGRVSIIPHGVTSDMSPTMRAQDHGVRSRLKLPKRFALFVGTIEPRKNLIALVEGVLEYRQRTHDDLHLVIAGGWGWKSHNLRRRLWKRDTQGWVHELGYVQHEYLPALYRSAEVLVWPSIYEGFGLPPLESIACGTPVITSHTSSLPEVLGDAAIYIDPYNSRDISEALRGLIGSSTLTSQLIQRGLNRASSFTWKLAAEQTLAVFHSCSS
jgi:glycosyltransferase involved in cell wall biosynthesis